MSLEKDGSVVTGNLLNGSNPFYIEKGTLKPNSTIPYLTRLKESITHYFITLNNSILPEYPSIIKHKRCVVLNIYFRLGVFPTNGKFFRFLFDLSLCQHQLLLLTSLSFSLGFCQGCLGTFCKSYFRKHIIFWNTFCNCFCISNCRYQGLILFYV